MSKKKKIRTKPEIENCPICGQYMEIRCVGHRDKPFVDGFTYDVMCFVCYSIPKSYVRKSNVNDEDIWEGPYFDANHLYTPQELIEEGICDDIKIAKHCYKSLMKRIKLGKKRNKI